MDHDEAKRLGEVVDLVSKAVALEPTLQNGSKADYVAAAERVLFALRVALEDAGVTEPLAVMAAAVDRDLVKMRGK